MNTIPIELHFSTSKLSVDSAEIKELEAVNSSFPLLDGKRSSPLDPTIIVAIVTASSALLGIFVTELFKLLSAKKKSNIKISVKSGEKEIGLEFNSKMGQSEITALAQDLLEIQHMAFHIESETKSNK